MIMSLCKPKSIACAVLAAGFVLSVLTGGDVADGANVSDKGGRARRPGNSIATALESATHMDGELQQLASGT